MGTLRYIPPMKMIVALALGLVALSGASAEQATLRPLQTIALGGVAGRFDHFAIDLKALRLFVAALGNNTVEVVDLVGGTRLKTIAGLKKPQGVAYLADQNQIVVAGGGDGTVKFFNGSSYALEHTVTGLDEADNVRFDPADRLLYVGFGDGALAIVDASTAKKIGEVMLPGHPESFQLATQGPQIFVNVPDAKQIVVVDRKTRAIVAKWPLNDFQANFPMALDEGNQRLFVGCRRPARLVALDMKTGRRVADLEISGDTDDLFYDATRQRLYASCGAGFIDVIDQKGADEYALVGRIPSSSGARTSYFSPDLHQFFLAVPVWGNQKAEIRGYRPE